nr:MAG TPA: hypothetical protein [Caudoviricetes sp.]DAU71102.1 MAG TPA: hypothetical protein [Caudoviricetes sp.]
MGSWLKPSRSATSLWLRFWCNGSLPAGARTLLRRHQWMI